MPNPRPLVEPSAPLPGAAARPPSLPLPPRRQAVRHPAPPPLRVLLIEDQPIASRAMVLLLAEHGIELHPVPSAEAAFLVLAREPAFEAIVTDLRLPGMGGHELARRLRQPRLIALSGDAPALRAAQHFDARMLKPCDPDALVAAIRGSYC